MHAQKIQILMNLKIPDFCHQKALVEKSPENIGKCTCWTEWGALLEVKSFTNTLVPLLPPI